MELHGRSVTESSRMRNEFGRAPRVGLCSKTRARGRKLGVAVSCGLPRFASPPAVAEAWPVSRKPAPFHQTGKNERRPKHVSLGLRLARFAAAVRKHGFRSF